MMSQSFAISPGRPNFRWTEKTEKMDERAAIQILNELIVHLDDEGEDTSSIRQFFDVGEWLVAFEGIEAAFSGMPPDDDTQKKIRLLERYFSD
jgi:hypothetical protein